MKIEYNKSESAFWLNTNQRLIDLVENACHLVSSIVNNESPEGLLPPNFDDEDQDQTTLGQVIVNQSYRTVKTGSLLLCNLGLNISNNEFLSIDQVKQIGEIMKGLLLSARHLGTFSSVYDAFNIFCNRLFKSQHLELINIPELWLDQLFNEISHVDISITRRSAGVAFAFLAILSNLNESRFSLKSQSILKLIKQADSEILSNDLFISQVHCFNILRSLFRDASCFHFMVDFIEQGLLLSIKGFSSTCYYIRNCASMLFSTVFSRCFNCKIGLDFIDYTLFFHRYPKLLPFLTSEIERILHSSNQVYLINQGRFASIVDGIR